MTEEEMRTKKCHQKFHNSGYCEASACAAWRWSNKTLGADLEWNIKQYGEEKGKSEYANYIRQNPQHGYCGLAGRP